VVIRRLRSPAKKRSPGPPRSSVARIVFFMLGPEREFMMTSVQFSPLPPTCEIC